MARRRLQQQQKKSDAPSVATVAAIAASTVPEPFEEAPEPQEEATAAPGSAAADAADPSAAPSADPSADPEMEELERIIADRDARLKVVYAEQRAQIEPRVQRLLDRFAEHHWAVDYPTITFQALAQFVAQLVAEGRVDMDEATVRQLRIQEALLAAEFRARTTGQEALLLAKGPDGAVQQLHVTHHVDAQTAGQRTTERPPLRLVTPRDAGKLVVPRR